MLECIDYLSVEELKAFIPRLLASLKVCFEATSENIQWFTDDRASRPPRFRLSAFSWLLHGPTSVDIPYPFVCIPSKESQRYKKLLFFIQKKPCLIILWLRPYQILLFYSPACHFLSIFFHKPPWGKNKIKLRLLKRIFWYVSLSLSLFFHGTEVFDMSPKARNYMQIYTRYHPVYEINSFEKW